MQRWADHSSVKCIIASNFEGQIICSTKRGGNKSEKAFRLIDWTMTGWVHKFHFTIFNAKVIKITLAFKIIQYIHFWLFFVSLSRYGTVSEKFWKFIPLVLIFGKIVLHSNKFNLSDNSRDHQITRFLLMKFIFHHSL